MPDTALIGLDIGTSSVKALMIAADGSRLAAYGAPYPTRRPAPGRAEQDPADWMTHLRNALAQFAQHPQAAAVSGIGVTSQVNTHVFCDAAATPLCPAITWQDTRAHAEACALDARLDADTKIAALGAPMPIDASHALARMAWMAASMPQLWARTAHVLAPKDYAIAQLTGGAVVSADPIASVGLVGPDLRYAGAVLDLVPRAADCLPGLVDPIDQVGVMAASQPFAGVPVVCGTMDAWAAMFGVGVADEGTAMNLCGTSDVIGLVSALHVPTPGVIAFPRWRDITLHAAPTQAGGAALRWLAELLGDRPEALARAPASIGAHSPLFLPHLDGERAPLWDPQTRGTFAGLSVRHGRRELVAAVMEGVAFSARLALEAAEASGATRAATIRIGGGGAQSQAWCQMRANVFGRETQRMRGSEPGALGAAVIAGVGVGLMPDLSSAVRRLVPVAERFTPDPAATDLADTRYDLYRALYTAARPINAALA